jgi:hypothetical protein
VKRTQHDNEIAFEYYNLRFFNSWITTSTASASSDHDGKTDLRAQIIVHTLGTAALTDCIFLTSRYLYYDTVRCASV